MKADASPVTRVTELFRRAFLFYQQETGQSFLPWLVVALLSFAAQIIFRRAFGPGEFGTLNTVLGVIGLFTVPVVALNFALVNHRNESLIASRILIVEMFALGWGALAFLGLLLLVPLLDLPRFSIELFALLNIFVALGTAVSAALCQGNFRRWGHLLMAAAAARVLIALCFSEGQPWAEAGLAAVLFAGLITLIPALRQREGERHWLKAWQVVQDRQFLLVFGATLSVFLSAFLFSSADRFIAQSWFGNPGDNNMGFVRWDVFDAYQTAGLLGRSLIWGTQPLLLVFFLQRSRLDRTTSASLRFFWIYLGVLLSGAILLTLLARPVSWLFCGADFRTTALLVPGFALAMVPIGLLQGLGIFALASRRYPECFVLGGSGTAYAILLYLVSRQPQLMVTYMFGGALLALMIVLFVGVVRWGRKPEQILWNKAGSSR